MTKARNAQRAESEVGAPSPPPADGDEELAAAEKFVHYERTHFGRVDERRFPFTRQLKRGMQLHFPDDEDFFRSSDRVQRGVMVRTVLLRIFTFGLFLLFLRLAYDFYRFQFQTPPESRRNAFPAISDYSDWVGHTVKDFHGPPLHNFDLMLCALTVAGFALFALRFVSRWIVLDKNDSAAATYAHNANQKRQHIAHLIQEACHNSHKRRVGSEKRVARARKWPKIAAWYARRGEVTDRYTTTVLWIIGIFFVVAEVFFVLLKVAVLWWFVSILLGGFSFFDFSAARNAFVAASPELLEFVAVVSAIAILGWGPFFRSRNDAWTRLFKREFGTPDEKVPHFFNAIAEVVEECVTEARGNQENLED